MNILFQTISVTTNGAKRTNLIFKSDSRDEKVERFLPFYLSVFLEMYVVIEVYDFIIITMIKK